MQGRISGRYPCRNSGRRSLRYIGRSQRGGALIEIMMSALLVALAATAVFKGIDGATATSGQSKSRAVAVTLAQEDQERMRSMDPRKLSGYNPAPVTKKVNNVDYKVTSTGDWVSDRTDSESCTRGDGRVTYVKINSKVEWPEMGGSKPVSSSSIVSINNAYAKGSLAVKIVDRTGATGVPAVPVTVNPPVGVTKSTNDAGCVVFDGLDAGAYTGSFSKIGYVDPAGINLVNPVNGWNVTTGSTAISTYQYDRAGDANFTFDTKYLTTAAWNIDSPADNEVTVVHQNIPGSQRRETPVAANTTTAAFTGLFPFTTAYSSFAGNCTTSAPGWTTPSSFSVPPGGTATPNPVKLRMPSLGVKVQRSGSTPSSGTYNISVRPASGACVATRALPNATSSNPTPYTSAPTSGTAAYAFPPGSFIVCADDNPNATGSTRKAEVTVDNNNENGQLVTVNITGSALSNNQCP